MVTRFSSGCRPSQRGSTELVRALRHTLADKRSSMLQHGWTTFHQASLTFHPCQCTEPVLWQRTLRSCVRQALASRRSRPTPLAQAHHKAPGPAKPKHKSW